MSALTSQQIVHRVKLGQPLIYAWFNQETEGKPGTAWNLRLKGPVSTNMVARRIRGKQKRLFPMLTLANHGYSIVVERETTEVFSHEVDGHGHVYFFDKIEDIESYVLLRKRQFAAETASIGGAIAAWHRSLP